MMKGRPLRKCGLRSPMLKKILSILLVAIIISFFLITTGCLLNRVSQFKGQLCHFDENFAIQVQEELHVLFFKPILLDQDIRYLAGAEPSEKYVKDKQLIMKYVVHKTSDDSNSKYDMPIHLFLDKEEGEYKLSECVISKNLSKLLTHELISRSMKSVCKSTPHIIGTNVKFKISRMERILCPTKEDLFSLFGEPKRVSKDGSVKWYEFRLVGQESKWNKAIIETHYDHSGNKLLRVKVKYLRYDFDADFVSKNAVLRVRFYKSY